MITLLHVSGALMRRAIRAQFASQIKPRVFYHAGAFWRVKLTDRIGRRIVLEPVLRSIDDCTVAEWKAATK